MKIDERRHDWRQRFPEEDLALLADLISAYRLGRKIFLTLFFTFAAVGLIALVVIGFNVKH